MAHIPLIYLLIVIPSEELIEKYYRIAITNSQQVEAISHLFLGASMLFPVPLSVDSCSCVIVNPVFWFKYITKKMKKNCFHNKKVAQTPKLREATTY